MERESKRGVGRDAPGPHGYTVKIEHYLRQKGAEGATLDELVTVAVDEVWIGRGFAHRMYAERLNRQARERARRSQDQTPKQGGDVETSIMTPELVAMQGLYPNAVRFLIGQGIYAAGKRGTWCRREGNRWFATGQGLAKKPSGWTAEELNQTPEEIGADMAMREVIRMLRPHMHQQTHKFTQAEWNAIRHWLKLAAIGWQP